MKSIGIVRKVDELGRIVLPAELRNSLGIEKKNPLEIYVESEYIILKNINLIVFFVAMLKMLFYIKGETFVQYVLKK